MTALHSADKDAIRDAYNAAVTELGLAPRWGQRQMIAEVANTIARAGDITGAEPPVGVIEAGTGTGKTIAYVLPAVVLAQSMEKRLVIATATIALQEQLLLKDLPAIREASGLKFDYALAKGRRRYLCLSQLDRILARESSGGHTMALYPDEAEMVLSGDVVEHYHSMLDALGRGDWDGDRDSWPINVDDTLWMPLTADQGQCTGRRCPNISNCTFYRAREGLQDADLIVTNHDLVLSDLALGGGAILPDPADTLYIFDEGHHLPDKALNHFSSFCRLPTTLSWLLDSRRAIQKGSPLLGTLPGADAILEPLPPLMDEVSMALEQIGEEVLPLIDETERGDQLRFPQGVLPHSLREASERLAAQWGRLQGRLVTLEAAVDDALEDDDFADQRDSLEAWQMALGGMLSRGEGVLSLWQDFAADPEGEDPPRARWLTRRMDDEPMAINFHCSHIIAADLLTEQLWDRARAAVLTSATMTALGSFDRLRARAGTPEDGRYAVVASPFDYRRATLHIPAMQSEPSDAMAHTDELIQLLPDLMEPQGGTLILFSSRRQLNDVYDGLPNEQRAQVIKQDDYSKQEVLKRHREAIDEGNASTVFGLASFAEGVDLPGDYCRHVIIAKLPFSVPDDPVDAALSEWLESQGRNPFMEISVPDAALRLVQACGRLLRTETDEGRVTLLDRRLLTKRYGQAILDSLPPFNRDFR